MAHVQTILLLLLLCCCNLVRSINCCRRGGLPVRFCCTEGLAIFLPTCVWQQ